MLIKRRQLPGFTRHSHLPSSHARTTYKKRVLAPIRPTDGRVVMPLRPRAWPTSVFSPCPGVEGVRRNSSAHTFFAGSFEQPVASTCTRSTMSRSNGSQRSRGSRSLAIFISTSLMEQRSLLRPFQQPFPFVSRTRAIFCFEPCDKSKEVLGELERNCNENKQSFLVRLNHILL